MKKLLLPCVIGALLTLPALAQAQANGADKAAAEALFDEGVALVAAGSYAEGCRKLEGSQALDPTLGTELRLADCYERWGKTASAWASFKHARGVARVKGQSEREELARQRVEALEPQLAFLSVELEGAEPPGLLVERDGRELPLASLGVALPVDPGEHRLRAAAPGYEPWEDRIVIEKGSRHHVLRIPALHKRTARPSPVPREASQPVSETLRTGGFVLGAAGVAGILAGSGLGWYAKSEGDRSKEDRYCPTDNHNGCTAAGVELRDRARAFATASTVTFVTSAALLTTGIVLLATAPSRREKAQTRLELQAAGMAVRGTW